MKNKLAILAIPFVAILTGCSVVPGGSTMISPDEMRSKGSPTKSESRIAEDGTQSASHNGLGPTLAKQDSEGIWLNSSMPVGMLTADPETNKVFLSSHGDAEVSFDDLQYVKDETQTLITGTNVRIVINNTSPITATGLTYEQAFGQLIGLSQEQADVRIQEMLAAGNITESIASRLFQAIASGGVGGL